MLGDVWHLCQETIRRTSLDTFTDSNTRERLPYEGDGYITVRSWWALRAEWEWPRHSLQFVLNNPTWPTEWKQYTVLLAYEHYLHTADASLADDNFDILVNNTMLPFVSGRGLSEGLIDWSDSLSWPRIGISPVCHSDEGVFPRGVEDGFGRSCDNIDWLPKYREGFRFSAVNTVVNAFAVRAMEVLALLASATGRPEVAARLTTQAGRTRRAMLAAMFEPASGLWCDGLCAESRHASFHAQHYALWLGLTPEAAVPSALAYLRAQRMAGSTYSASSVLHGLYERAAHLDHGQLALELMTSCAPHSWCSMLKGGATTTWEHWFAEDGSKSHPWSSSPASAIASGLMGIRPTAPGWTEWVARPATGNLTEAAIIVPTPRGAIHAELHATAAAPDDSNGRQWQLQISIPPLTDATLCAPLFGAAADAVRLRIDDADVQGALDRSEGYVCVGPFAGGDVGRSVTMAAAHR
mmetsp:Transcript_74304/g.204719  ORF Transcript_74304/g.204719 Transcript_74304/m.204719 type:complete len:467 (+) Transcript_74304:1483-2883(+)